MNSKNTQPVICPFHKDEILIDVDWAATNGRVFCEVCCKSFEVQVKATTESTEETIKEKFDKGVKEILEDESGEYNFYSEDF